MASDKQSTLPNVTQIKWLDTTLPIILLYLALPTNLFIIHGQTMCKPTTNYLTAKWRTMNSSEQCSYKNQTDINNNTAIYRQ